MRCKLDFSRGSQRVWLVSIAVVIGLGVALNSTAQVPQTEPLNTKPVLDLLDSYEISEALNLATTSLSQHAAATQVLALVYLANNLPEKAEQVFKKRPVDMCEKGVLVDQKAIEDYNLIGCSSYFELQANVFLRLKHWQSAHASLVKAYKAGKPNSDLMYAILFKYAITRKYSHVRFEAFDAMEKDFLEAQFSLAALNQLRDAYVVHVKRLQGEIIQANQSVDLNDLGLIFSVTLVENDQARGDLKIAPRAFGGLKALRLKFNSDIALLSSFAVEAVRNQ